MTLENKKKLIRIRPLQNEPALDPSQNSTKLFSLYMNVNIFDKSSVLNFNFGQKIMKEKLDSSMILEILNLDLDFFFSKCEYDPNNHPDLYL